MQVLVEEQSSTIPNSKSIKGVLKPYLGLDLFDPRSSLLLSSRGFVLGMSYYIYKISQYKRMNMKVLYVYKNIRNITI